MCWFILPSDLTCKDQHAPFHSLPLIGSAVSSEPLSMNKKPPCSGKHGSSCWCESRRRFKNDHEKVADAALAVIKTHGLHLCKQSLGQNTRMPDVSASAAIKPPRWALCGGASAGWADELKCANLSVGVNPRGRSSSQCRPVEPARADFYWEKFKETQPKQGQEVTLYTTSVKCLLSSAYPPAVLTPHHPVQSLLLVSSLD